MSKTKLDEYLQQLKKVDGVYLGDIQARNVDFESIYLKVRQYEKRLLSDEDVAGLPVLKNSPHTEEWKLRNKSAHRTGRYFSKLEEGSILDLGCGNGWFSSLLANNKKLEVVGMDVNLKELKQAAKVFKLSNLKFLQGDIFQTNFLQNTFDFITLNAVIQYFENLNNLLPKLFKILKPGGEIHIIDSPFYTSEEVITAKERTNIYYKKIGFEELASFYYHHSWEEISEWDFKVLYDPKQRNIVSRFLIKDMPFPWIKIKKS